MSPEVWRHPEVYLINRKGLGLFGALILSGSAWKSTAGITGVSEIDGEEKFFTDCLSLLPLKSHGLDQYKMCMLPPFYLLHSKQRRRVKVQHGPYGPVRSEAVGWTSFLHSELPPFFMAFVQQGAGAAYQKQKLVHNGIVGTSLS